MMLLWIKGLNQITSALIVGSFYSTKWVDRHIQNTVFVFKDLFDNNFHKLMDLLSSRVSSKLIFIQSQCSTFRFFSYQIPCFLFFSNFLCEVFMYEIIIFLHKLFFRRSIQLFDRSTVERLKSTSFHLQKL